MGYAGAGFGQGFAQTLMTLGPIIQQRQQQREQFDLQKRESDLKLKMLDLETEKFQRELQSGKLMESLMSQGVPSTAMSSPEFAEGAPYQTREPFNMGNPQHQQAAAAINPKLRDAIFAQQMKDASAAQQRAADEQAFAGFGGAPQQQAPPPQTAPTAPAAPGGTIPPGTVQKRSMTLGPTGLSRTITNEPKEAKGETGYIDLPGGYKQLWRTTRDPMTDAVIKQEPVGAPILQETLSKAGETASTYGLKPGTPEFRSAMAEIVSTETLPPDQRTPALAEIRKRYGGKGGMEERAMADANRAAAAKITAETPAKVAQAEAVIRAETPLRAEQARQIKTAQESVPEKPTAQERKELAGQLSVIDAYGQVNALYKPEFVGPATSRAAGFKERTIGLSTRESQFRQANISSNNALLREAAGLSMTATEIARIESQQPTPDLPSNVFEARMEMSKINAKIVAIRKRQVMEATGVDVSKLPAVTLTRTEQQKVAAPIVGEYQMGQISRQEALAQLQGLSQYTPGMATGILDTIDRRK